MDLEVVVEDKKKKRRKKERKKKKKKEEEKEDEVWPRLSFPAAEEACSSRLIHVHKAALAERKRRRGLLPAEQRRAGRASVWRRCWCLTRPVPGDSPASWLFDNVRKMEHSCFQTQ